VQSCGSNCIYIQGISRVIISLTQFKMQPTLYFRKKLATVIKMSGFFNSSIGTICVAKCEEEDGQIIIIQGIGIATKTCVVFNIIVKKIKLKHPNLTSQILPECNL
jgi:hypothetical protein